MNPGPMGEPGRQAACRALILTPRPQPPEYLPHTTIDTRRLHLLMLWDSEEALKLTRAAGLEVPCARPTT
jgi:hypothetical protein